MKNVHIVTGGGSGIGLDTAKSFKDGIVIITGRNEEGLKAAVVELKAAGIEAEYRVSDVSSRQANKDLVQYAATLGKVKTVVNSAGVSGGQASAKKTLEIDLLGAEYLVEEVLEVAQENTVVILIASMMGNVVPDNEAYDNFLKNPQSEGAIDAIVQVVKDESDIAYNFAKKGVQMLAKKWATKYGEKGARIVSLSPGIIMTPMSEQAAADHPEQMAFMKQMTPSGRNGNPDDISHAVMFLADDKSSFLTGIDLTVDGGLTNRLPEIAKIMAAQEK
ncbi:MAG: SDR family oxidoreductase [Erysipelothrix sp.]|nr:SDR family oxidoreductase [Erysipelothrix sp.]